MTVPETIGLFWLSESLLKNKPSFPSTLLLSHLWHPYLWPREKRQGKEAGKRRICPFIIVLHALLPNLIHIWARVHQMDIWLIDDLWKSHPPGHFKISFLGLLIDWIVNKFIGSNMANPELLLIHEKLFVLRVLTFIYFGGWMRNLRLCFSIIMI